MLGCLPQPAQDRQRCRHHKHPRAWPGHRAQAWTHLQRLLRLHLQHNQNPNRAAAQPAQPQHSRQQVLPTQEWVRKMVLAQCVLHPTRSARVSSRLHKQSRGRNSRSRQPPSGRVQVCGQVLWCCSCWLQLCRKGNTRSRRALQRSFVLWSLAVCMVMSPLCLPCLNWSTMLQVWASA